MKSQIIEELGEAGILLPGLIREGLAANDRIKLRLSVLQGAGARARQPDRAVIDLQAECRAAAIAAPAMTALIAGAHLTSEGMIAAPNLATLLTDIAGDAATMIHAVGTGDAALGATMTARLAAVVASGALAATDQIAPERVAQLTAVTEGGAGSLHRLVMDLHKALNHLAVGCTEAMLAGAHVFGLRPDDSGAVESFMRGLNKTRALKFDHPGLDTLATRTGERLLIQNDIGTTDAHVVVIAVDDLTVTVTYTDVHRARARFFVALLDGFALAWSGLDRHVAHGLADDGAFYLVTGRCAAESVADRDDCLAAIGASLTFLIYWNKARKVLRGFVAKSDVITLLTWAARHRIGTAPSWNWAARA